MWEIPYPNIVKTILGPIRSFIAKENHIGSTVSDTLRYRQEKLTTLNNRIVLIALIVIKFYGMNLFFSAALKSMTNRHLYL